jgi:hypothetical protein
VQNLKQKLDHVEAQLQTGGVSSKRDNTDAEVQRLKRKVEEMEVRMLTAAVNHRRPAAANPVRGAVVADGFPTSLIGIMCVEGLALIKWIESALSVIGPLLFL